MSTESIFRGGSISHDFVNGSAPFFDIDGPRVIRLLDTSPSPIAHNIVITEPTPRESELGFGDGGSPVFYIINDTTFPLSITAGSLLLENGQSLQAGETGFVFKSKNGFDTLSWYLKKTIHPYKTRNICIAVERSASMSSAFLSDAHDIMSYLTNLYTRRSISTVLLHAVTIGWLDSVSPYLRLDTESSVNPSRLLHDKESYDKVNDSIFVLGTHAGNNFEESWIGSMSDELNTNNEASRVVQTMIFITDTGGISLGTTSKAIYDNNLNPRSQGIFIIVVNPNSDITNWNTLFATAPASNGWQGIEGQAILPYTNGVLDTSLLDPVFAGVFPI